MSSILRILLVDDDPGDRALIMRELEREFPNSEFGQVTNIKELTESVDAGGWNLAVLDYQLRWTNGINILSVIKGRWPDCPVIMFTGSGSEEIAVQAMKEGLDDYVIKSAKHYVRLPAAARMAIERIRQKLALREAETRYQSLFNDMPVGLFRIGRDGRVIDANPTLIEMLGYPSREALLSMKALNFFANPSQQRELLSILKNTGLTQGFEAEFYRCDGKQVWETINARVIYTPENNILCYEGSMEDITERKRNEKILRDSREQLRALAAYLQSVREEERSSISREVHDELGQALTSLKMDLAWLNKKMSETRNKSVFRLLRDKARTLPSSVDEIINTVRKIATELRPPILDDLGLEAAIEWQIREFERRTGIKCKYRSTLNKINLNRERATAVFRIFQEILTNIVRHAGATEVSVFLKEKVHKLILEVKDNGCGLMRRELRGAKSLGLLGMRERAAMLDGAINIVGRYGNGTTVGVCIPLDPGVNKPAK